MKAAIVLNTLATKGYTGVALLDNTARQAKISLMLSLIHIWLRKVKVKQPDGQTKRNQPKPRMRKRKKESVRKKLSLIHI